MLFGLVLTLRASNVNVAFLGFAVLGLGVSVGCPLAISAAANLRSGAPSTNVATLTVVALLGFLLGPPVIGFLAEYYNLRIGLAALLPVLILS